MFRITALWLVLLRLSWAQPLPDAPSAKRVADKYFWTLTASNGAATLSDAISTSALVGHGNLCPTETWEDALYGKQAHDGRVFGVMSAKFAASVVASYYLKKYNVHIWKLKLWAAPQIYNAQGHMQGAIHNLRYCR
jgi:hypothetical protein